MYFWTITETENVNLNLRQQFFIKALTLSLGETLGACLCLRDAVGLKL